VSKIFYFVTAMM